MELDPYLAVIDTKSLTKTVITEREGKREREGEKESKIGLKWAA